MEADWEFEIGPDAPVIDALWHGFVDLREDPEKAKGLVEARQLPGLENLLMLLNAPNSSLWTTKTDVFEPEWIDPDELDAESREAQHRIACYIDLLMRDNERWTSPAQAEQFCKSLCGQMRAVTLRRCRVDLVIRSARVRPEIADLGATAYFTACGESSYDAKLRLYECVQAFVEAVRPE